MDDDAKKVILARRARFVAAALASVGVAMPACEGAGADPCLSFASGGDATTGGTGAVSGAGSGGSGAAQPCLSPPLGGAGGSEACTGGTSVAGGEGGLAGEGGDNGENDENGGTANCGPQACLIPR